MALPPAGERWGRRRDARPPRASSPACSTSTGAPVVVRAWQRRDGQRASPCGPTASRRAAREVAIERMRFALGVDDDYRRALRRAFAPTALLGPAIRQPPLAPAAAPALGLGGARLVGHQAADRVLAGGRRSSGAWSFAGASRREGPDGATLRDVPTRRADRRPRPGRARGDGPGAGPGAGPDPRRARGGRGPGRPGRPGRRPPPAGDPRDRPLDGPVPGPLRPRRARLAARRRPRLHQAGRPPRRARPPRHRRGGGGVLRPLRPVSAASPAPSCWPPTTRRSPRGRRCASPPDAAATSRLLSSGSCPGSRSLVSTSPVLGRALITPWSAKNWAKRCHCCGSM